MIIVEIANSFMPFLSTIGFGCIAGFLIGFALKRIMKILVVIAGIFFAALIYLESQHIVVNVNWDKLQTILSNSVLLTIATATTTTTTTTTTTNATSTNGGGVGPIQATFFDNNSTNAATSILPITSTTTMANLGISLTDSTAMGFTVGFLKG